MILHKSIPFILLVVCSLFLSDSAYANNWLSNIFSSPTTISHAMANADSAFRVAIAIVKTLAFSVGFFLCFLSLIKFVRFSDGKEQLSSPLLTLISGIFLVSFVPAIDMLSLTVAGSQGATSGLKMVCKFEFDGCANVNDISNYSKAALTGVITFIRLIGFIAVFRGFYMIFEMGKSGGGGNKTFFASLMHICGGIACINSILFAIAIANQIAPNSALSNFLQTESSQLVNIKPINRL